MAVDTRVGYRFGPMPSWYAHRQIAHDHVHSQKENAAEPAAEPLLADPEREGPVITSASQRENSQRESGIDTK